MAFTNADNRPERSPIARRKVTFTTLISEDTKSIDVPLNGELLNYAIDPPALTNDTTFDFSIANEDGDVIYSNTGIADTDVIQVLTSAAPIPMAGVLTLTMTFATAQVAVFDLYLYYR